jgi:hypothetical protein
MKRVVDATASSCGLTPIHSPGEETHGYSKGYLSLGYDLGSPEDVTGIFLQVDSRKKSPEFIKIESILTLKLRYIDRRIMISSGYLNPMM